MANKAIMPFEDYQAACDAIREKTGGTALIKSGEMAGLIEGIVGGGSTENLDAEVAAQVTLLNTQEEKIAELAEILAGKVAGEGGEPKLQDKMVTPTTSSQTINADEGYDGLDTVTVNAMPTATQAIPSISIDANGKISASATQTAGYVSAGTKTGTKQLTTQAAKTITPTESTQTAVAKNVYTTGVVSVGAIPSEYIVRNEINEQDTLISNIMSALEGKAAGGGNGGTSEWSTNEDAIINGTISIYTNDRITTIGNYAFYCYSSLTSVNFPACTSIDHAAFEHCKSLTTVNFPACTSIGDWAFGYCPSLTSISFPVCTTIWGCAFDSCISLTSANFPVCTSINGNAFAHCTSLTSVSFPACTSIGSYAFNECSSLTSVNFPACSHIGIYAFEDCTSLTSANFPVCKRIDNVAFRACSSLTSVNFPVCSRIGYNAFEGCTSLTTANFPVCKNIGSYAFYSCYSLISLYLTGSSLCTLSASDTFSSTPIGGYSTLAGTYGSIYVPQSLLISYQTATNWAYFSSRFVGLDIDIGGDDEPDIDDGVTITFTVGNTSYQAKEGMTWGEWVDSKYNTGDWYNDEQGITDGMFYIGNTMTVLVSADEVIIADKNYRQTLV